MMNERWLNYAAEGVGTAFMVAFGLSSVAIFWSGFSPITSLMPDPGIRRLLTGVLFATGVMAVIYSPVGRKTGAHINPSVTLSLLFLKKIAVADAFGYVMAQCIGAVFGSGVVYLLFNALLGWPDALMKGVTLPDPAYGVSAAFAGELVSTFILMAAILGMTNWGHYARYTGLVIGAVITVEVWIESPFSGASLNAARSFGPALLAGEWKAFWIYAVAPLAGALMATSSYRWIYRGACKYPVGCRGE